MECLGRIVLRSVYTGRSLYAAEYSSYRQPGLVFIVGIAITDIDARHGLVGAVSYTGAESGIQVVNPSDLGDWSPTHILVLYTPA